ncbi:MAG: hypothetical protein H8M99_10305 [Gloeobacteraceae cyanobacterium ES-bin-144]|nr:hypothetical protein [Verrucomicrobiales bacterium]
MNPSQALAFVILLAAASFGHAAEKDSMQFQPPPAFRTIEFAEFGGGPLRSYQAPDTLETVVLHQSESLKVIMTVAKPPTTATPTTVAGLFVLVLKDGVWTIADSRRFEAVGKDSGAKAEATQSERAEPHFSLTLYQGGRGHSFAQCVSYMVVDSKFKLDTPTEKAIGEQFAVPNGPEAFQFHLNNPSVAPVGALLTLCKKRNNPPLTSSANGVFCRR